MRHHVFDFHSWKTCKIVIFNTFLCTYFRAFQKWDVVVFLELNNDHNLLAMFMVIVDNFERNRLFCLVKKPKKTCEGFLFFIFRFAQEVKISDGTIKLKDCLRCCLSLLLLTFLIIANDLLFWGSEGQMGVSIWELPIVP